MSKTAKSDSFDQIVEWAYGTLPQEIRDLPDFPGIQVTDEPPENVLKRKKSGRETLGMYSGVRRTQQRHNDVRLAPNLIFVFRGPIQRCSRGDLRAEVKEIVWHEVAHWLGHSEEEVKELGLGTLSLPARYGVPPEKHDRENELVIENADASLPRSDNCEKSGELQEEPLRCLKCYSAEIECHTVDRFITHPVAWLSEPVPVRARICTCRSCGYEWDDEDDL